MSVKRYLQALLNTRTTYAEAGKASMPRSGNNTEDFLLSNGELETWSTPLTAVCPDNGYVKAKVAKADDEISHCRFALAFYTLGMTQEVNTTEIANLFVPVVKGGTVAIRATSSATVALVFVPLASK